MQPQPNQSPNPEEDSYIEETTEPTLEETLGILESTPLPQHIRLSDLKDLTSGRLVFDEKLIQQLEEIGSTEQVTVNIGQLFKVMQVLGIRNIRFQAQDPEITPNKKTITATRIALDSKSKGRPMDIPMLKGNYLSQQEYELILSIDSDMLLNESTDLEWSNPVNSIFEEVENSLKTEILLKSLRHNLLSDPYQTADIGNKILTHISQAFLYYFIFAPLFTNDVNPVTSVVAAVMLYKIDRRNATRSNILLPTLFPILLVLQGTVLNYLSDYFEVEAEKPKNNLEEM